MGQERRILPIIRLIREATLPSQFAATALLLKLLVDLHSENLKTNTEKESPHTKLNLLMREIRNSHRWWTVEEMAEYANLSENNLRKLFREQTGTSPKHFLDQLWLNRAIDLLCSTDLSLADAARKTGCADPYYFPHSIAESMDGNTPPANTQVPYKTKFVQKRKIPRFSWKTGGWRSLSLLRLTSCDKRPRRRNQVYRYKVTRNQKPLHPPRSP